MEKHLIRWSYWLGISCFAVALFWKALIAIGMLTPRGIFVGQAVGYMSLYKAAFFFLVLTIATANYASFKTRKAAEA